MKSIFGILIVLFSIGCFANELDEKLLKVGYGDQLKTVTKLIEAGANVNAKDKRGYSPLINAIMRNQLEIAKYLITKGADVNAQDAQGFGPLVWTILLSSKLDYVKLLVEHGADVNAKDKQGFVPLIWLISRLEKLDYVKLLVEHGADVNAKDNRKNSVLCWAAHRGRSPEIVQYLIAHGADIQAKYETGESVLTGVLRSGDAGSAKLLITKGVKPEPGDPAAAAQGGNLKLLKYLIEELKMNPNIPDRSGYTPLMYAALAPNLMAVEYLSAHGADLKQTTKTGFNVLMLTAGAGRLGCVRYLVEKKQMDVNAESHDGTTALALAIMKNQPQVREYLLLHGAKTDVPAIARAEKVVAAARQKDNVSQIRGTVTVNPAIFRFMDELESAKITNERELKALLTQPGSCSEPQPGVKVVLRGETVNRETVTDAKGEYVFADLPNENFVVMTENNVALSAGNTQLWRAEKQVRKNMSGLRLQDVAKLELTNNLVAVRGRIVDAAGQPLVGVKVTGTLDINDVSYQQYLENHEPDRWYACTDRNGKYELKWIPATPFIYVAAFLFTNNVKSYHQLELSAESAGKIPAVKLPLQLPLIAENQLPDARRWLKILNRIKPENKPELVEKNNQRLPKSTGNIIMAEDIVLK